MSVDGWENILDTDEKILWQGQPDGRFRLRGKNIALSIFGLFFLGFSLFWITMASTATSATGGAGLMFPLFGLPFVLIGLYLVIGIHWFDALGRRKTHYTLTDKRAFIATGFLGKRLKSYPIDGDTVLELRPGTPGSVFFAKEIRRGKNGTYRIPIGFELIPDAEKVYQIFRTVQKSTA